MPHYLIWLSQSLAVFLLSLPVTLLGLPLVALGLPFRREFPETKTPFTQYPGEWMLVRLPTWLKWWDNQYDGLLGDKRGWWDNDCQTLRSKPASHPYCMWLWAALRNPANYFSRNIVALDISRCTVTKLWGDDEVIEEPGYRCAQFLMATRDDGKRFYRMFISWAIPGRPDKALMLDIGWKFKLKHSLMPKDTPDKDRLRGDVFVISPWKTLR